MHIIYVYYIKLANTKAIKLLTEKESSYFQSKKLFQMINSFIWTVLQLNLFL